MTTFQIAVVAHTSRLAQADKLADMVGANTVMVDDGTLGCTGNHRRALERLGDSGAQYAVVLEDDAQPVDEFYDQIAAVLDAAPACHHEDGSSEPAPLISFYLGTGYPLHWQTTIRRTLRHADKLDAPWIVCDYLMHAVAYAVRTDLIHDLLEHMPDRPIDQAISAWAIPRGRQVVYTYPSLVDHADADSVIQRRRPRQEPRKAHRVGERESWRSVTTVALECRR